MMLTTAATTRLQWRHDCWFSFEVDVDAAFVFLGCVLKTKLLADLLNSWLDFLNMISGMVPFSDDPTSCVSMVVREDHKSS